MRSEVEHHLLVAAAEYPRVRKCRHTGADLDRTTSGVIQNAVVEGPPVNVPGPAREGAIYNCGPEEYEYHGREYTTALGDSTSHEGCSDTAEHHLSCHSLAISSAIC